MPTTPTINPMTGPTMGGNKRGTKRLSSSQGSLPVTTSEDNRYALKNAAPRVQKGANKLLDKTINDVPTMAVALPVPQSNKPPIQSNVRPQVHSSSSDASVSGITSAAEQYNSYRFDEISALKTYKKMMTLHLKEDMFRKLKFITNDAMLEYSRSPTTLCGYVCTKMRVPDYQWAEYWKLVNHTTKKMIEQQRTNATSAVKKGFKGKCHVASGISTQTV